MEQPELQHKEAAAEMARIMQLFHQRGWSMATSANCSFRPQGTNGFVVSRSGVDKAAFSESDFLEVLPSGIPGPGYEGQLPSAETLIHALIYGVFPDARCILHTHSVAATVVSLYHVASGAVRFQGYEMQKAISGVGHHDTPVTLPVFHNSQDMALLCAEMSPILRNNSGCRGLLLAGHGLYAWGQNAFEAKRHVEAYEFLLDCALHQLPKR